MSGYRVRRRLGVLQRGLTDEERGFLLGGYGPGFHVKVDDVWVLDEAAASAAWREHRDELWDATLPPLVPYGAVLFDGATGPRTRYEHLRGHEALD